MSKKNIGVIVGSTRKEAYSLAMAKAVSGLMPEGFNMELVKIDHLPLYNQDYDDGGSPPPEYEEFREKIGGCDGFLFITPEHNRSFPAALKNALDIASRPYGHGAWAGKPGAVISVSPGKSGAFGANHHLRQVMTCLDIYTMQQPEAYIGNVDSIFDSKGNIQGDSTRAFLKGIADSFGQWVNRLT